MFRIKICGITNPGDACVAAEAGADAIGLNCYPHSRRYVDPQVAARWAGELPSDLLRVGVFVNASHEEILRAVQLLNLDAVQLHGDETPHFAAQMAAKKITVPWIRAFRVRDSLEPASQFLRDCAAPPAAVLLDSFDPKQFGGSGQVGDWRLIAERSGPMAKLPVIVAGGLTPLNVAAAIAATRAYGVDTASGVEGPGGAKDAAKVQDFVAAAKAALASTV